jgi:propionyl-CoA carboxylase beta chain
MSWDKDIEELRRREALAEGMGGEERVARQKAAGKLTARERVAALLDGGSFHETGKIAGKAEYGADNQLENFRPTPFVVGRGQIDGRPVISACAAAPPTPASGRSSCSPSRWPTNIACR